MIEEQNNNNFKGCLVISLDLELYWGVRDLKLREKYKKYILGERYVIPVLLEIFKKFEIHATWAVVGFLFAKNKEELIKHLPLKKPSYLDSNLSPYNNYIDCIGNNEEEDQLHYARSLIELIREYPHQEIGTHTFSHYYCLENGQNIYSFEDDLKSAVKIADKNNIVFKSLVFPRNQINNDYLPICKKMGIKTYRGTESAWFYRKDSHRYSKISKLLRLIDSYVTISSNNCYRRELILSESPANIPSSKFLRPYNHKLKLFENIRLNRIVKSLTYAAKYGLIYHLWWHPHNFGINIKENLSFLSKILEHYLTLRKIYGMQSMSMGDFCE